MKKALEFGTPVMIDATMDRDSAIQPSTKDILRDFLKLKIGAPVEPASAYRRWNRTEKLLLHTIECQLAERHKNLWLDVDDWQVADQKGFIVILTISDVHSDGPASK
ncbi:MAG: hypothetical protein IPJ07_17020 [Acidobacteria bacterium]|nr:hypothetical protein [Acidobacteriota bacterium]